MESLINKRINSWTLLGPTTRPYYWYANTRLYNIWHGICQRCENPNSSRYHRYGGRGIKLYQPWRQYTSFAEWADNNGYADNLSIDRINNNGDYCPTNCQWISISENGKKNMTWVMRSDGTLYRGLEYAAAEHGISAARMSTLMSQKIVRNGYRFSYCNPVDVV